MGLHTHNTVALSSAAVVSQAVALSTAAVVSQAVATTSAAVVSQAVALKTSFYSPVLLTISAFVSHSRAG